MPRITPNLWFDNESEEAAAFYVSVFPNSRITAVSRYPEGAPQPAGTVLTVDFVLDGQEYTAINGGPQFPFTEAISLLVNCADQEEIDYYWDALSAGGEEGQCGWLKDRYGVSWQVVAARDGGDLERLRPRTRATSHAGDVQHAEDRRGCPASRGRRRVAAPA